MRKRIRAALAPVVLVAAAAQDVHFNKVWAGSAGSLHWGC
jgi:hypothetical protein